LYLSSIAGGTELARDGREVGTCDRCHTLHLQVSRLAHDCIGSVCFATRHGWAVAASVGSHG